MSIVPIFNSTTVRWIFCATNSGSTKTISSGRYYNTIK